MKPELLAIADVLSDQEAVVREWLAEVTNASHAVRTTSSTQAAASEAANIARAVQEGLRENGDIAGFDGQAWERLRGVLESLSRSRAAQGATAGDTSFFLLSFKRPLFARLQQQLSGEPIQLVAAIWAVSTLVDKIAQFTLEIYQRSREDTIHRQQQELLELSTPVIKLWDGVLAVPMIGTLDSSRTQLVMESLLQRIVETGSELAIIDITGVPTVDTLVAQHLLKTVAAIRLMGADCIISGIRPQIAQTIVHLGVDLGTVVTKATLADAFRVALSRTGCRVEKVKSERPAAETAEMH
jgi:rsbT co-antagonist protein RsbR